MSAGPGYDVNPIGVVHSPITRLEDAPKQGSEGAPDVWIEFGDTMCQGLEGIKPGDEIIVLTWFDRAQRDVLKVHPRGDTSNPLAGVFTTRSPDRPNPIGLHRVTVKALEDNRMTVGPMEAIDDTPVIDIKPVIRE